MRALYTIVLMVVSLYFSFNLLDKNLISNFFTHPLCKLKRPQEVFPAIVLKTTNETYVGDDVIHRCYIENLPTKVIVIDRKSEPLIFEEFQRQTSLPVRAESLLAIDQMLTPDHLLRISSFKDKIEVNLTHIETGKRVHYASIKMNKLIDLFFQYQKIINGLVISVVTFIMLYILSFPVYRLFAFLDRRKLANKTYYQGIELIASGNIRDGSEHLVDAISLGATKKNKEKAKKMLMVLRLK